jgi:hypothetical protein
MGGGPNPTPVWVCGSAPPDAGADADADAGPDCVSLGGTCESSGTVCADTIPTDSCGDPSMWVCCGNLIVVDK